MTPLMFTLWVLIGGPTTARAQTVADATEASHLQPPAPSALELAYQKEFAFLHSEKEALAQHRLDLERRGAEETRRLEEELRHLESQLLVLQRTARNREDRLGELERTSSRAEDAHQLLVGTLAQAQSTLDRTDLLPPDDTESQPLDVTVLKTVWDDVARHIALGRTTRRAPGVFFLSDGSQVEGTRIDVGRVASFGVSGATAGALIPVGEGRLQLLRDYGATTARALAEDTDLDTFDLFLYEQPDRAMVREEDKDLRDTLRAGGPIGGIILGLGFCAALLAVLRAGRMYLGLGRTDQTVSDVIARVEAGDTDGALATCTTRDTPATRVLEAVLRHAHEDRETAEQHATEALLSETPGIERFGTAISVVAAVAPLLGLLGTVTGMISTFDVITEYGTGDPKMLSGGISEALVTTQLGLVVAIPGLLVGNLLNARAEHLLDTLERGALRCLNALQIATSTSVPEVPDGA